MLARIVKRKWIPLVTLFCYFWSYVVVAQQIITDGNTRTSVAVNGIVSDVSTTTVSGQSAYNSFSVFDVNQGNVVNLHLPDGTVNLLNLVHDKSSNIQGMLNAVKDGQIGGNVYFANPHGFVVGSSGVVNVGSLSVATPSTDFMDRFFTSPGLVSPTASNSLLNLDVPISATGLISIRGKINASGDIHTASADFLNSGTLQSGAAFSSATADFSDVINLADAESASALSVENGEIWIVAGNNVEHSGVIASTGGDNLDGGNITVRAGNDVVFLNGAVTTAAGVGAHASGGIIDIYAENNASLHNSSLDVSAGDQAGDGGFAEFSAANEISVSGARFYAGAANGEAGSVLIDPAMLNVSGANLSGGGGLSFQADDTLTVKGDALVSSRALSSGSHAAGASSANSGDIRFEAGTIVVEDGAEIYAHANNGFNSGDVDFDANAAIGIADDPSNVVSQARIDIGAATITGGQLKFIATASTEKDLNDGNAVNKLLGGLGLIDLNAIQAGGMQVGVAESLADASVRIGTGASLVAESNVDIDADATSHTRIATTDVLALLNPLTSIAVSYADSEANAEAVIASGASVSAGNALTLDAQASNDVEVTSVGLTAGSVLLSISETTTSSIASIESGAIITAQSLAINATSSNRIETSTGPLGLVGANGGGISLSLLNSTADASLASDVDLSGDLTIKALSDTTQNTTKATSKIKPAIASLPIEKFKKMFDAANNPAASSATMALAESHQTANASIGTSADVSAQNVDIEAEAIDNHKMSALSSAEAKGFSLGSSNVVGFYNNTANAWVGAGATVDAANQLDITATTRIPTPVDWDALNPFAQEDLVATITKIKDLLTKTTATIADALFTTFANAGVKATEGLGVAGVFTKMKVDNKASAYVGQNAEVNADSNGAANTQAVNITARNEIDSINVSGNVAVNILKLKDTLGGGGNALGGSVNDIDYDVDVRAYIADGATVEAKENVNVDASSVENLIAVSVAGGKAEKFGLEGSVNLLDIDNTVQAFVDDKAEVHAGNDVNITASDEVNDILISGGIIKGANVGVGFSWVTNTITSIVRAFFGNDEDAVSPGQGAPGEIVADNNLSITADSIQKLDSWSLAASVGGPGTGDPKSTPKGSSGFGASGDVSVNTVSGETLAYIDSGVTVDPDLQLILAATNAANVRAISGSGSVQSGAASSGLAGSYSQNTIETMVRAYMDNATIAARNDGSYTVVDIKAESGGGIFSLAVGGSSTGKVGVAGSVAVNEIGDGGDGVETEAFIKDTTVEQANIELAATDTRDITSIAGAVAVSGTAGIGPAVSINNTANDTHAYLHGATVEKANSINVTATNTNGIFSTAASAGVGTTSFGGAGSLSYNTIENSAHAYDNGSTVVEALHDIAFVASDTSEITSIAGGGAFGSSVGVGISAAYNDIGNDIIAYLDGSAITTDGSVVLDAMSDADIETFGVGIGVGGSAGLAGSVSINRLHNTVNAEIINGAVVRADENVQVAANNLDELLVVAGSVSGGSSGAGGGAVVLNIVANETNASVQDSEVDADANGDGLTVYTGVDDETELAKGLIVAARSRDDLTSANVNGSGGGSFGVALSVSVNSVKNQTRAFITSSQINQHQGGIDDAAADQQVRVSAYERLIFGGGSGSGAGGGGAGVGVGIDSTIVQNTTEAYIAENSTVHANDLIDVAATHREKILSASVGGAGGGSAGVVGSGNGARLESTTAAWVADSELGSDADIEVQATEVANLVQIAGGGAGGGAFGGAGAVGVGIIKNTTSASIDSGSTSNASGTTAVRANADETIDHYVVSVSGGGAVGVAASTSVKVANSNTRAFIGTGASVNQDSSYAGPAQNVLVNAISELTLLGATGGVSGGGTVGGGAAIDLDFVKGTTSAFIDDGAQVAAQNNITVNADADKNVDSWAIAGSGGGFGAVSGMVSVVNVGAKLDADSLEQVGDNGSFADDQLSGDITDGAAGSDSFASAASSEVGSDNSGTAVSGDISDNSTEAQDRTSAFVGDNSVLSAGGSIGITSMDNTVVTQNVGGVGISGGLTLGASVGIVNTNTYNQSYAGQGSTLSAGGDINVIADTDNDLESNALAGSGGIVGLGASVAIINDSSVTLAEIQNGAVVEQALNVNVRSDANLESDSFAFGAVGGAGAVGASIAHSNVTAVTRAQVDDLVEIGQLPGQAVGNLTIDAVTDADTDSLAVAGAAGIVSGTGSDARSILNTTTSVDIGQQSTVTVGNNINVKARGLSRGKADAAGVNVAGITVGVSIAKSEATPVVSANVGDSSVLTSGNDVNVLAGHNVDAAGGELTSYTMESVAFSAAGALAGGVGADADTRLTPTVSTDLGDNAQIIAQGDATVTANSVGRADAEARGFAVAVAAGALTNSDARINNHTDTRIGAGAKIAANNITVASLSNLFVDAFTVGGNGGGLALGGTRAKARLDNATATNIGADSLLDADQAVLVEARTALEARSDVTLNSASIAGVNVVNTDTDIVNSTTTVIDDNATLKGDAVTVQALVSKLVAYAKSFSQSIAAVSDATARSNVDVESDVKVTVKPGAELLGLSSVLVKAVTSGINLDSIADSKIIGFTGNLLANAHGDLDVDSDIDLQPGSIISSADISIIAESIYAASDFNRDASADGATVVNWVLTTVEEVVKVVSWIPFIGSIIKWVTKTVTKLVRQVLHSEVSATSSGGNPRTDSSILINGTLAQLSALSPELTVNADGSITSDGNINATKENGEVVVNGVNNTVAGSILISAPGGSVSGNGTLLLNKTFDSVNINNYSTLDLRIQEIDVVATNATDPDLNIIAEFDNTNFDIITEVEVSDVNIAGYDQPADIIIAGHINNPVGVTNVSNEFGDIYTDGGTVESNRISLEAGAGDIGRQAAPIALVLVKGDGDAELESSAGGNAYIDAQLVEFLGELPADPVIDGLDIRQMRAGQDMDLNLKSGLVQILSTEPGQVATSAPALAHYTASAAISAGADLTVDVEPLAELSYPLLSSTNGSVTLNQQSGDAVISRIDAVNGDVNVTAPGSILNGNPVSAGATATNIHAINMDLNAGSGSIGTPTKALELKQSAPGRIDASAPGSVNLSSSTSGLGLGLVSSSAGDVDIAANGSIVNANTDGSVNIVADSIDLQSITGAVGAESKKLVVDTGVTATSTGNVAAATGIYLEERNGGLRSSSIATTAGPVELLVSNGNASLTQVRAAGDVTIAVPAGDLSAASISSGTGSLQLTAGGNGDLGKLTAPTTVSVSVLGSSLVIDDIDPQNIQLSVAGEGGELRVASAVASNSVDLAADNIQIDRLVDSDDGELKLQVTGNDGGIADTVTLLIETAGSLVFDLFKSAQSYLEAMTDSFTFNHLVVHDELQLKSSDMLLTVTYKDQKANEGSGPLVTRDVPAELIIDGDKITTDGNPNLFFKKDKFK